MRSFGITHRSSWRRPVAAFAVTGLLITLAACGSDDADTSSDTSSETASSEELGELASQLPQSVIDAGSIKNAVMIPAPPFEFEDESTGELTGIDIDLVEKLSETIGFPIETTTISDFAQLVPGVQSGRYDMVMSGVWDTTERQEVVDLVDYMQTGMGIVVEKDSGLYSLDDLCGQSIVTGTGTAYVEQVQQLSTEQCGDPDSIKILTTKGAFAESRTYLTTGRAVATADGYDFAGYQISENFSDELTFLNDEPLYPSLYAVVVNPELDSLTEVIQQGLQKMVDDGSYQEILDQWGQQGGVIDEITVNAGTS